MRYEARAERLVVGASTDVAARGAAVVAALGGKALPARDGEDGGDAAIEVRGNFNKKVGSRYLQNRIEVVLAVAGDPADPATTRVRGRAWPVDPLGRPLAFGVLGDPAAEVLGAVLDALAAGAGAT